MEGYKGTLCSECIGFNEEKNKYFASNGKEKCEECGQLYEESLKLIGLFIVFFLYVAALVA
jgi:hypothetical protein